MRVLILAALCVSLALAACGEKDEGAAPSGPDRFDAARAFEDLEDQVAIGPRPSGSAGSREVVALIASRLRAAGVEDVRVQRPWRNVVGVIPGSKPGAVVVGAHHDTKDDVDPSFQGANDGASGVAVVLELARVLTRRAPLAGPSIHVALFDAEEARGDRPFEEDGTRGSRQYVSYAGTGKQGTPELGQLRAMVLFDMVGDCDLQIPREQFSNAELYGGFERAAEEVGGAQPFGGETSAIGDDHIPFLEVGVPAVDLIDFAYGPGPTPGAWWHTSEDTLDKVCPESLDAVGEAALVALPRIG